MNYIVLDLEWNQPRREEETIRKPFSLDGEIIEFGAVKLDENFKAVDEYREFVNLTFYPVLNGYISKLTKIPKGVLKHAPVFPKVYRSFLNWCGEDYCFLTWGPDDIPMLMDNLLMHGLPLDTIPDCFDLQKIFGHELTRDDRQCSLENAMKILNEPIDRSHDALNDARNTARVCSYLDLADYLDEYVVRYVNYGADRMGEGDRPGYGSPRDAMRDLELTEFDCPYCGEHLTAQGQARYRSGKILAYARCSDEDEFLMMFRYHRNQERKFRFQRMIFQMSDDLWDTYQEALERDPLIDRQLQLEAAAEIGGVEAPEDSPA